MNKIFEPTESQKNRILDVMKNKLISMGFATIEESCESPFHFLDTEFSYGSWNIPLRVILDTYENAVCISISYGLISSGKRRLVSELISHLNMLMIANRFVLTPDDHVLNFTTGYWLLTDEYDGRQFEISLQRLLNNHSEYTPLIFQQLNTNIYPKQIMERFLEEELTVTVDFLQKEKMH